MSLDRKVDKIKIIKNPIHFIAFGLGLGFAPIAPGTFGTLLGIFIYLFNYLFLSLNSILLIFICCVFGIYICGKTAKDLNYHDHPGIVWDEVVGYLVTMLFLPFDALNIVLGFIIFRFFDILKPWPILTIDKKVQGGLGIMLDDLLAGVYANLIMNIIIYMRFV